MTDGTIITERTRIEDMFIFALGLSILCNRMALGRAEYGFELDFGWVRDGFGASFVSMERVRHGLIEVLP